MFPLIIIGIHRRRYLWKNRTEILALWVCGTTYRTMIIICFVKQILNLDQQSPLNTTRIEHDTNSLADSSRRKVAAENHANLCYTQSIMHTTPFEPCVVATLPQMQR